MKKGNTLRIVLSGILFVCIVGSGFVFYAFQTVKPYSVNLNEVRLTLSAVANEGGDSAAVTQVVKTLANTGSRAWVNLSDVPKYLIDAIVSTEDKSFFSNDGVDYLRTLEAAANSVFHFLKTDQGGSTITQQVIKNLAGNVNDRTVDNKLREIVTALDVDKRYSKEQIMEVYVNIVTLGVNCYGVQAAAELYFGKSISELDLAQCAALAAILPSPNAKYNPVKHPENVRERCGLVLRNMLEQGMITQAQYTEAVSTDITFHR